MSDRVPRLPEDTPSPADVTVLRPGVIALTTDTEVGVYLLDVDSLEYTRVCHAEFDFPRPKFNYQEVYYA